MKRPNITEERLDEIISHSMKIDSIIKTMSDNLDDNEFYIMICMIFLNISFDLEKGVESESELNMIYVLDLMLKKAKSLDDKEK